MVVGGTEYDGLELPFLTDFKVIDVRECRPDDSVRLVKKIDFDLNISLLFARLVRQGSGNVIVGSLQVFDFIRRLFGYSRGRRGVRSRHFDVVHSVFEFLTVRDVQAAYDK